MERITTILGALALFLLPFVSCTQRMSMQTEAETSVPVRETMGEEVSRNSVNARILRQFIADFGEMNDAKWYKSATGYRATFKADDVLTRVYYKSGGVQECIIRYYFEDRLKKDIRHRVKSDYYDYAITHVTEVSISDVTAYHIKLESKNEILTVKMTDDAMEVTEKLLKR